ncbi:hypothetical protein [Aureimonas phyllosphaerae]|uniref:Uncharacterized protein n=1 Tax=Aureimonas phyllosphaerae TaxID=1166078 RepID=A0A7W6BZH5_9HYPH|nr:hypothetical protein [Aureimonas phyllosphaerae]MBB3936581.1 hypothetical protein [Aureimonas phyllosphaerae]MBB3960555.1 hypothetical protein [Aureimonas phyllosphaerae]SFF24542.1 hypothetical protein SAMN05216566_105195 [Aureimonas phyllosphaerae]
MTELSAHIQEAIRATPIEHPEHATLDELEAIGAKVADCHANAAAWVSAHPGYRVVPGWLIAAQGLVVPHSNVETSAGRLLDVTPREDGDSARIFQFIRWHGSDEEFRSLPTQGRYVPADGFSLAFADGSHLGA